MTNSTTAWSATYPWSGFWWPTAPARRNLYDPGEALAQYDAYVLATRGYDLGSRAWERRNHASTESWAGNCQAWAAAAILTREPPKDGLTRAGIRFDHDALEGLITTVYQVPGVAGFWGTRNDGPGGGTAGVDDFDPAWMDYLLRYYVGQHGSSFVMDIDAGRAVWNFPVAGYQRSMQPNGDGTWRVTTDVWFRSPDAGTAGYDQDSFFRKRYEYDLWNTADGRHSTGRWVSADHPDFAWAPGSPRARDQFGNVRNPHVDPRIVEEILGYAIT